jgi:heptosyltransferase I
VVRAIQSQWPDCSITWVIGKPEHQLLGGLAGVEFIVFDKSRGLRAYADLHRALKGKSYDVLLHMQVAARANLASLLIRSPLKLGWDNGRSRDRHKWFVNHQVPAAERQHQAQGFLSFARSLGLNIEQPSWNLPISDKARSFARNRISGDRPSLLISPCSSHVLRNWRAEYYAAVADYAISKLGMQVVLSGGPSKIDRDMGSSQGYPGIIPGTAGQGRYRTIAGFGSGSYRQCTGDSGYRLIRMYLVIAQWPGKQPGVLC